MFDSNILAFDENLMLIRLTELVGPCIVMVYMVQQINCIRNREGEIIEVRMSIASCGKLGNDYSSMCMYYMTSMIRLCVYDPFNTTAALVGYAF